MEVIMYDWKAEASAHERKARIFKEAGMYEQCKQSLFYAAWCRERPCWVCGAGYDRHDGGCTCDYE